MGARFKQDQDFQKVYEVDAPIGRGRKSIVYKAKPLFDWNASADLTVALKIILGPSKHPELDLKRLRREAVAMLSCRHKNIIQLYDFVTEGESPYLAMEIAEKGDLRQLLEMRKEPLPWRDAVGLMKQAACGLVKIHRVGIVHRDIKPENLLLTEDNILKIADFGIAFLPTESVPAEEANQGIGTVEYLAPESLEDGVSNQATDVYSCAVTLYQLITGHLPFGGNSFSEQIENKMSGNVQPMSKFNIDAPEILDVFFQIAFSADASERFNTASEFEIALDQLIRGIWVPTRSNIVVMPRRSEAPDANQDDDDQDPNSIRIGTSS